MATALVHLETLNSRTNQKVPSCRRSYCSYSGRYIQFDLTDDKSRVTCQKCAKLGGFEAAKPEVHGQSGTCQCCFGSWQIVAQNISLHGYKRPGIGFIVGKCWGAKHLPFEVSCERTKALLAEYQRMRDEMNQRLADLQGNKVETLTHEYQTRDNKKGRYIYVPVKVQKGAKETTLVENPEAPAYSQRRHQIPAFETLRNIAIGQVESRIRGISLEIEMVSKKLANWKQVWTWDAEKGQYVEIKAETEPADPVQAAKETFLATQLAQTTCPCCKKTQDTKAAFGTRLINKAQVEKGAAPKIRLQSFCRSCR